MKTQIWRKKFIKRKEEKQEITIVHPEIITILIKKPEDIAIIAQQLKDEIDMKLRRRSTSLFPKPTIEEIVDKDSHKNHTQNPLPSDKTILLEVKTIELENEEEFVQAYLQSENIADLWINKTNVSTELAKKENKKKEKKPLEQMVPSELMEYM